ncbi:hypothetical protein CYLTODRAFT_450182 [Cylindrobasidium torrendii FP15055 ss-10]|uniref:Uncharacterized protein n=1 Tax=Cylindrobasidium torrendii FP15055 ss-10 TaxID=1314674 RepID=A0A0D7BPA8_9AGAR|nr:hypothetical protein CYLTODRAFT_450182 [Cylindrobasidium torrendii FP15055 ss-10]
MSIPTPLRAFLGGFGLSLPVHALTVLNGSVLGISGFVHRAATGNKEALVGFGGLVVGGCLVGLVEDVAVPTIPMSHLLISGVLLGLGSKMANGCTSGHMLAGIARLSKRSIAATATFFAAGAVTAHAYHGANLLYLATLPMEQGLTQSAKTLILMQIPGIVISTALYFSSRNANDEEAKPRSTLRLVSAFNNSLQFAVALSLSALTDYRKVISFLLLPRFDIDPTLAFLAAGAMPASYILFNFVRRSERPALGGPWNIPKQGEIDQRLLVGSTLFGVGWAMAGVCTGPAVVNLGRSLATGNSIGVWAAFLGAVIVGGRLA